MTRYSAERAHWDGQDIVVLSDAQGRRCLRIACHGAALLNFEVPVADGVQDLAAGYHDGAEVLARPGSRFAIMAPFAGRIADARYRFDGQVQDLQPGVTGAERASRHGFVRDELFTITELSADADGARVTLSTAAIRPQPGYPHAIDLAVSFALDAAGLTLEATMHNVGASAAPCFFGWHPYFRLADQSVDGWMV
ncbi:MAG: aldose 1-epimerase, partial [Rhodanobacter sp.]